MAAPCAVEGCFRPATWSAFWERSLCWDHEIAARDGTLPSAEPRQGALLTPSQMGRLL